MEKQEIENLVKLRQKVIEFYSGLDGNANPGTALMKQQDTAHMLETIVRSVDHILSDYVKFD